MRLKLRLVFACIFICTFMQFGMVANAKDYDIKTADFDVILNEDGSADVTEEWTLEFTSGEFTRFYKEIYKDVTKLEKYNDISFKGFWINDVPCEETFNTITRDDYTYYMLEGYKLYDIQWYYHAKDEKVVYRVEYTILDVVKETDNNVALFCYRYLGEEFDKRVDKLSVKITAPDNCDIELRYGKASVEKGYDYISLSKNYAKGMVKFNVAMPANVFSVLDYIPLEEVKKAEKNNIKLNKRSFTVIGTVVFWLIVFGIITSQSRSYKRHEKNKKKYKKIIKKNPNHFQQLLAKYQTVSPIYFMIANTKKPLPFQFLKVEFFDLVRRNIIKIDTTKIVVSKQYLSGLNEFEVSFFEILFQCAFTETAYEYEISMTNFTSLLRTNSSIIQKQMKKLYKNWYKRDRKLITKAFKKDCAFISCHLEANRALYTSNTSSIIEFILRTQSITYDELLYLVFYVPREYISSSKAAILQQRINAQIENDFTAFSVLTELMDFHSTNYIFSNGSSGGGSGCSSCSSCSSCSGCGGGGAD